MNTQSDIKNRIIVILGAGRTGTSLLTKILVQLGMGFSAKSRPSAEHNPDGIFEDDAIVKHQKEILSALGNHAYLPLMDNFLQENGINKFIKELRELVLENISASQTLWGFKDPRTPSLLPLWMRVFNTGKIVPTYVLTVRDPQTAVSSMHKQYGDSPHIAELTWLHRNCEALYHTGGNCFIVHYEDWFSEKASMVGSQLLHYTGLDKYWNDERSVSDAVGDCINPHLNRAVYNDYELKNRYVKKLYSALQDYRGDSFDRQKLMDVVIECRKAMEEFSGWPMMAQQFFRQREKLSKKTVKNTARVQTDTENQKIDHQQKALQETQKKLETLEQKYVDDIQKYIIECKDFSDQNEHFRIRLSVKEKELVETQKKLEAVEQKLGRINKELFKLKTSTSFKVGLILVKAVARPGKNTLLFPLYLLRVFLSSRAVKN